MTWQSLTYLETPRERLKRMGAEHLSNSELVALVLGSGTAQSNVFETADSLMKLGEPQQLALLGPQRLTKISGIGEAGAARLCAAFALGKRLADTATRPTINSSDDVLSQLQDIKFASQEHLIVLYLNAQLELLKKSVVAKGSLNQVSVKSRDIFSKAVTLPCSALIVGHNHPSGIVQPSNDDRIFTKQLAAAGELLGITVLDHIIVAQNKYYSFRESSNELDPSG